MFTTPVKPQHQLQQHGIAAKQQHPNPAVAATTSQLAQLQNQRSYLCNINFLACATGSAMGWQTKPQPQLFSYRQFIRVWVGSHFVLAFGEQISEISMVPNSVPNNLYFWIDVTVGVFQ